MSFSVLICGAGNIAHRFDTPDDESVFTHVKAFQRHAGFEVQEIIDGDVERAHEAASIWNIPHYGTCLEDVRNETFDVISICTPDHTHAQYLRDVLAFRPKLVFCEKPLSLSVDEASAIVEAYKQADVLLAVNYSRRWLKEFRELSLQAASGAFGKVVSARIKYYKGLVHNASHFLDLLQMLTGFESGISTSNDAPSGIILQAIDDYTADDTTLSAALRITSPFAGGSSFTMMIEGYDSRQMHPLEMECIFENISIKFEELSGSHLTIGKLRENAQYAGFFEFSEQTTTTLDASRAMQEAVSAIHDACTHGTPLASTGATALATLWLCKRIQSFPHL
jgi:predicted dehydrogenase